MSENVLNSKFSLASFIVIVLNTKTAQFGYDKFISK